MAGHVVSPEVTMKMVKHVVSGEVYSSFIIMNPVLILMEMSTFIVGYLGLQVILTWLLMVAWVPPY